MEIPIIDEDSDLIVINKPPGIPVHGGPTVQGQTVVDFLVQKFPEIAVVGDDPARPGLVHRLDKDTSGVMVIARTQEMFEMLKNLFKDRHVQKTYLAICCGILKQESGIIDLPIGRLVKNPLKRGVEQGKTKIRGAREAVTEYRLLQENEQFSLVELHPKTGRMHQIRVHMKAIGNPVACDPIYGGKAVCCPKPAARLLLHAQSISFVLPGKGNMRFEADPPDDFQQIMRQFEELA